MAMFKPDASKPIVWNWINNDLEICPHEILGAIEHERDCEKTDLSLGFGSTAIGVLSTAVMLGLAGVTVAMVPAVALAVAGALHGYNAGIQGRRRELESEFISDYPDILKAVESKLDEGQSSARVASAYESIFRLYRRGDDEGIIKVLGKSESQTHSESGLQPSDNEGMTRAKGEALASTEIQPIAIDQDATVAAAPSLTSAKPGDSIGLDLAAVLIAMPEFCHVLLAGENGTGKTTFALALLKPIIDKFIQIPGFELLLIDPKRSRWNGLFQTKSYQSAFSNQPHDLEKSVNRLEQIYFKLDRLSSDRQKTGKRTDTPTLVIIDEVNTWLDALKAFDRNFKEENSSLPPADRLPALRLYNRAVDSIAGISRMGREDRVWLWLIGQNSNLEALGLSGAQDRANFSIVAVGLGDNQITIELALGNSTMFTRGQALKNALKEHQGKPYQIAACTRKPANLLIMPGSYKDNAQEDFSPEILARLGATSSTAIAPPPSSMEQPIAPPSSTSIENDWRETFAKSLPADLSENEFKQRYQLERMLRESSSLEPQKWSTAPTDNVEQQPIEIGIEACYEIINGEPDDDLKQALMISFDWFIKDKGNGRELTKETFLNRAKTNRKSLRLKEDRQLIWDELEGLISYYEAL